MRLLLVILIALVPIFGAKAAIDPTSIGKPNGKPLSQDEEAYQKSNCPPSDARLFMEFNDVRALVEAGGSLWQNRQSNAASYEVPVGGGNHVLYSGSIWMGGLDVNGQLKLAAIKFRRGNDFWTGPLSQTVGSGDYDPSQPVGDNAVRDFGAATITPDVCIQYDRFFSITKAEVINYTLAFECGQDPDCDPSVFPVSNTAIQRINNWPAHGNIEVGQDYYLAPFYDYPSQGGSGDGVYDPTQGDIPWFDDILGRDDVECGIDRRVTLFGDETHWWVFNDKGNIHTETGADPIGMEIHAQAFSFATNDEVNQMTFYNYEMINRSSQTLYETYFTQYADADIGFSEDDYVGCDVSRGLGYAYNAVNFDNGQGGSPGYGGNVPAVGIDFFEGPYQDADGLDNIGPHWVIDPVDSSRTYYVPSAAEAIAGKGIVYEGIGIGYSDGIVDNERFGMRRFNYYNREDKSPSPAMLDPSSPGDYYNYMNGRWRDNSNVVYGGNGYSGSSGATNVPAAYCFPGDSDPLHWGTGGQDMGWGWSERDSDGSGTPTEPLGGDRRFLQTAGPFTLKPGAVNNLTVGVVFGRAFDGNAASSIDVLLRNDTKAQALFDNCFEIMDPPTAPVLEIVELENELILLLDNPFGNNVGELYAEEDKINIIDPIDGSVIYDKYYRFEGYQIYQMRNEEATVSDINDDSNDNARLVAQCDIKNGITKLINFEFNEELGFSIPKVKVDGEDRGIRHSFRITNDAFNNRALVNHKTYYYIAVAYAHNEFKPFNPNDPEQLDGQKMPYISSRLAADGGAIKSVPAIPHSPKPRFDGAIVNLEYGSSPEITTLDGRGNGNRPVDLTAQTEEFIVQNGSIDTPTYQSGRGPINVKVVDPLSLVDGYFLMKFTDYNNIDTASWVIERYTSKGGDFIESISSNRTILSDNEQLIPEWGVSVQVYQDAYPCASGTSGCLYLRYKLALPIEATIDFKDSSKRWLTGISDVDSYDPANWIASGDFTANQGSDQLPELGVFNPECYKDLVGVDPNKDFARILDGIITIGQLARRNTCGFSPVGMPGGGISAGALNVAQEHNMPSVFQPSIDIVFTADKSKWSRVPVIELGSDPNLNVGGARAGLLRKSLSVDKEGRKAGDAGYNASEANPNGTTPTGMGWFPGYAIDVETGRRLNMAFGENSFLAGENGADMVWNPTSQVYSETGTPLMGGQHIIYVFGRVEGDMPIYDGGEYVHTRLAEETTASYRKVYEDLSWVMNPLLRQGQELMSSDVRVRVRINQQYTEYDLTTAYNGSPTYEWNMDQFRTIKNDSETLASALDMINVVPNPYYAYSEYERTKLETTIKITNLPEKCKVRIYNTSGKLIRAFDKDSPITSIDWDLKNKESIPVAGGIYLIHVHVEGVGDRVVKFFGGLRQPDLENL